MVDGKAPLESRSMWLDGNTPLESRSMWLDGKAPLESRSMWLDQCPIKSSDMKSQKNRQNAYPADSNDFQLRYRLRVQLKLHEGNGDSNSMCYIVETGP